jgi:hypothetical protein
MADRPRLLLVPMLTEIEWVVKPLLEEWADVATYDAPGVGVEPPVEDFGSHAIARRGLAEVDRREWDRFVLVADEFGLAAASHIAAAAAPRLQAVAMGHARLENSTDGKRPTINQEVLNGIQAMLRTDPRMFVRQMFKMTGGEGVEGGYQEAMADEFMKRVRMELMLPFYQARTKDAEGMGERFADLDVPMLIAQHKGCLMFTDEGFADAVAAFPQARTASFTEKPSTSPEFAQTLREFCGSLAAARA